MQWRSSETFGRDRQRIVNALKDEDYEDEGMLDLVQLKDVIASEYEGVDDQLIDYLLYYVYIRSESTSRMQYKHIITMLDDAV